jgi:hypothetical protein
MVYFIVVIVSLVAGGFLGYKFGDAVSEGVYSDYEKIKAELAKLKSKL